MVVILVRAMVCGVCSIALFGCSSDRLSRSNQQTTPNKLTSLVDNYSHGQAHDVSSGHEASVNIKANANANANEDLEKLKAQFAQQQQQLEIMNNEQQALQAQLKRQNLTLQILPSINANAGRYQQGTASIAHIAFLEDESQFVELTELAVKEISIIPSRQTTLKLNIPQDARFIAIKVGLRYTKKRSQLLIPISSIDFEKPLTLNVGACDVNIKEGITPELAPVFATKLKYYQQPLVACS
ncbi:hypothetical protein [Psychrobacter sp. DAB_AL43B]|uniref:hypothetical protein n=1 Tax=Psychrobacter sp. DAB_AL43B TaxID=1028416 RepID=UPI0009A79EFB|nr:hypothetical protein [Psychrobacter sp. DAB_AL43B]